MYTPAMLNPIVAIIVISPYRRAFLSKFIKMGNTSSVINHQATAIQLSSTHHAGQQQEQEPSRTQSQFFQKCNNNIAVVSDRE